MLAYKDAINHTIKLSGTITNLSVTPTTAEFGFDKIDGAFYAAITLASVASGSLGATPSQVKSNRETRSTRADYVEFDLNGKHCKGLVRKCFYKDGDEVHIAALPQEGHYTVYAIAEPATQSMALYPHCIRGTKVLLKKSLLEWLTKSGGLTAGVSVLFFMSELIDGKNNIDNTEEKFFIFLMIGIFILMYFSWFGFWAWIEYKKEIMFAKLAESCFQTLGLTNPENLDLNSYTNKFVGGRTIQYITFNYPVPDEKNSVPTNF